jgi:hypothetical protein
VRERLLSVLYTQRRRDLISPEDRRGPARAVLACPRELLAFHLWYLREKKLVERTDRGFAITGARDRRRRGVAHAHARGPGADHRRRVNATNADTPGCARLRLHHRAIAVMDAEPSVRRR